MRNNASIPDAVSPGLQFSEYQLDALAETFNLSLGEAAATLARLVAGDIEFSLPIVELASADAVVWLVQQQTLALENRRLCGILQHFDVESSFQTDTMIVLEERDSLAIARVVAAADMPGTAAEQSRETLAELGNAVVSVCMTNLSGLLQKAVLRGVPRVMFGNVAQLLQARSVPQQVIVSQMVIGLLGQDIKGYLLFMMDSDSLASLVIGAERLFSV